MTSSYSDLQAKVTGETAENVIKIAMETFQDRVVMASSLGPEDQVITHMALQLKRQWGYPCRIFVLETGRLHQETLDLMAEMEETYQFAYEVVYPNALDVTDLVKKKGEFSFYESIDNRKECCHIRKVAPLQQILGTADAWITGQRKDQAVTRATLNTIEWDEANDKIKLNPLADWESNRIWAYIKQHHLPYNPLHDRGYPSIGCEPCTRAIKPGEHPRAGRWWWEDADQKECGLHPSESD